MRGPKKIYHERLVTPVSEEMKDTLKEICYWQRRKPAELVRELVGNYIAANEHILLEDE